MKPQLKCRVTWCIALASVKNIDNGLCAVHGPYPSYKPEQKIKQLQRLYDAEVLHAVTRVESST